MRTAARTRRRDGGFSLLEVMISIAILGMALVILLEIVTSDVRATHHGKLITTATFLARTQMAALEDQVLEEGFVDTDQSDAGDFSSEGFPQFRWESLIERVELPVDVTQQVQNTAGEATKSENPLEMMAGFLGGFMSALIEPIRVGLENSVRRVSVRVMWDELGRPEQSFEVVAYMTDPAKLDLAVQAAAPGGQGGAGGSAGGGTGGRPQGGRPPDRGGGGSGGRARQ